jgi:hypothetical protein
MSFKYYSPSVLREVLPPMIVNDVINIIDEYLHRNIRGIITEHVTCLVEQHLNPKYVDSKRMIEDLLETFITHIGYSLLLMGKMLKEEGKPLSRSSKILLFEKLLFELPGLVAYDSVRDVPDINCDVLQLMAEEEFNLKKQYYHSSEILDYVSIQCSLKRNLIQK